MKEKYDFVILGAGIYGLYAATLLSKKGLNIAVLEYDNDSFSRASLVNQARVHQGYHYPRSVSTALTSIQSFSRFCKDYKPAINSEFEKIYAISNRNSYTSGQQFLRFCQFCEIPVMEVDAKQYFNQGTIERAFKAEEYSFDPHIVKEILLDRIKVSPQVRIKYSQRIREAEKDYRRYYLAMEDGTTIETAGVLNTTYASLNQILQLFGFEKLKIKYEMCEIILCHINTKLNNVGITVMDGPFFSLMPFGKQKYHSLSAVGFTPHKTSFEWLPTFDCQTEISNCTENHLENCNSCLARPTTAFKFMHQLAKKYLLPDSHIKYQSSLFAIKSILTMSEYGDSRPTLVLENSQTPKFISVLSGKINTIYEMDDTLNAI
jgi:hypothetical protein